MKQLLGFVEDPGAANFFLGLAPVLSAHFDFQLLATGPALNFLSGNWPVHDVTADNCEQILAHFQPELFLCGTSENPKTLGLSLIKAFQQTATPTVGLIDAFPNAAFRFRGLSSEPLFAAPDYLLVPDQLTAQTFISLGFASERIASCGHPLYDLILAQREKAGPRSTLRQQLGWSVPADQQLWIFAAEIETSLDPNMAQKQYLLTGRNPESGRTSRVLEVLLDSLNASGLRKQVLLAVRLHPKNLATDFAAYTDEVDLFSHQEPTWQALQAADRVIGLTSFLLIEAYLLGLPVWSLLPHPDEAAWLSGELGQQIKKSTERQQIENLLPVFYGGKWPVLQNSSAYQGASQRCLQQLQKWLPEPRKS